jgi:hypothetical protein
MKDKTAYVNGNKVLGTLEVSSGDYNTKIGQPTSNTFSIASTLEIIDFKDVDMSNVSIIKNAFSGYTNLKVVKNLNGPKLINFSSCFQNCSNLVEIDGMDMSSAIAIGNMFSGCTNLEKIDGFINLGKSYGITLGSNATQYKLDLSSATKLTHESLMNVINNLYDLTLISGLTQSLVLGEANLAKLTADEIAIASNKGWDVT